MKMRFVALIVATFVLLGGWFFAAFKPAQSKLGEVRAQVETTKTEVVSLTQKLEHLQALKRDEKSLRAQAARFREALPTKTAVSDFIRQVQDAAEEAGIDFLTVTPSLPTAPTVVAAVAPVAPVATPAPSADTEAAQNVAPPAPVSPLQAISVSLTADGKFFEIEKFVNKLEHLERSIRIDDFTLGGGGSAGGAPGQGGTPSLSLSIKLQMFLNKPAPVAPAAAAAPATAGGN